MLNNNLNEIFKMFPFTGDEVVEWNGRCLQRATFEEVHDIILESKQEPQVELIVHRSVRYLKKDSVVCFCFF